MDTLKRVKQVFEQDLSLMKLIKIALILLIIFLIILTSSFWGKILSIMKVVLLPFLIGFIIAYIIHPLVSLLERKRISRKLSVPIIIILVVALFLWLIITLFPLIYQDSINFINAIGDAINKIYIWYSEFSENPSEMLQLFSSQVVALINDYKSWFPNLTTMLPQLITNLFSFLTNAALAVIVAIYVLFDYERIRDSILKIAKGVHPDLPEYILGVDGKVSVYIRAIVILMVIKFFEYGLLYYLVGHRYWIIMAFLTSIGLLVPYFGAMLANIIGVLTALSLRPANIIILIAAMCILSTIDAYVISPIVHSRKSEVKPLWTLFSVFFGGIVFGPFGIMIAVPGYMSIREVIRIYRQKANEKSKRISRS